MLSFAIRLAVIFIALGAFMAPGRGGITSFTDRGEIDFDTALQLLDPYGSWAKIDGKWAYTPFNHHAPYTNGRWLYTEYGWYWKGTFPDSWATEHYGYWKRSADKVWSWFPGAVWLPQTVEIRETATHIGWRSAEVDEDGNFVEQAADRYSKPEEWSFVTTKDFTGPITPQVIVRPDVAEQLLDNSTVSFHTYLTYRAINRPGPHPADFVALAGPGPGMFPPPSMEELAAEQSHPTGAKPSPATNSPATNAPASNAPTFDGTDADGQGNVDKRQVKYWITMSLPTYWTPPPADAKPQEVYSYRPDFYQDNDGIERRITFWFNPRARMTLQDAMADGTQSDKSKSADKTPAGGPAIPAVPASAESDEASSAFRSPLDTPYREDDSTTTHTPSVSSKATVPTG